MVIKASTPMNDVVLFSLSILISLLSVACTQAVTPLSAADSRLPHPARQRIADAEDAVVIARSRAQDAQSRLIAEQERDAHFERRAPNLGSALNAARELNRARLSHAALERRYAEVEFTLSVSRLELIYAQTALRYDLAVYDLKPLNTTIEGHRKSLLQLRQELKQARSELQKRRGDWWSAYQQLAQSNQTQPYWVHEFSP